MVVMDTRDLEVLRRGRGREWLSEGKDPWAGRWLDGIPPTFEELEQTDYFQFLRRRLPTLLQKYGVEESFVAFLSRHPDEPAVIAEALSTLALHMAISKAEQIGWDVRYWGDVLTAGRFIQDPVFDEIMGLAQAFGPIEDNERLWDDELLRIIWLDYAERSRVLSRVPSWIQWLGDLLKPFLLPRIIEQMGLKPLGKGLAYA